MRVVCSTYRKAAGSVVFPFSLLIRFDYYFKLNQSRTWQTKISNGRYQHRTKWTAKTFCILVAQNLVKRETVAAHDEIFWLSLRFCIETKQRDSLHLHSKKSPSCTENEKNAHTPIRASSTRGKKRTIVTVKASCRIQLKWQNIQ